MLLWKHDVTSNEMGCILQKHLAGQLTFHILRTLMSKKAHAKLSVIYTKNIPLSWGFAPTSIRALTLNPFEVDFHTSIIFTPTVSRSISVTKSADCIVHNPQHRTQRWDHYTYA